MRLVFFGTPPFAVASLAHLVEHGYPPVAVVTAPDKPAGRGRKLHPPAVKQYAEAQGLPVLQPPNLKAGDFQQRLKSYAADLFVVVAFRMLPESVWAMPPKGTFNLHASLLPNYRGAAPIQWAIINGERETGVSTFLLKHQIDTGDLLLQSRTEIGYDETAGALYERLQQMGAELVVETVRGLEAGDIEPRPQPPGSAHKTAPKIDRALGRVDWHQSAEAIHNRIRGLNPQPGAFTYFEGRLVKLWRAWPHSLHETAVRPPGTFWWDRERRLFTACGSGLLELRRLQPEGKKPMDAAAIFNGRLLPESGQWG
jgi:methionyl-tRNA formyltransferase